MTTLKIFIVDDDQMFARLLGRHLSQNPEYAVETYFSGKECMSNIYKNPDVITLDYSMPDMRGDIILREIAADYPDIPVIVISGQSDIATAVNLLKEGAYDYIVKSPETKDILWKKIQNIRDTLSLKKKVDNLKSEVSNKYNPQNILKGDSKVIHDLYEKINKASGNKIPVMITGETGTGKELVAKSIHYSSARSEQPFVAVNMAAIPNELIESELFGYEKGAFTGANISKPGKFEMADNGTILLDEIAEMNMHVQAKLLRVLENMEITRLGSNKPVKVDIRIISATNKNLLHAIEKGTFRDDLYYRLFGIPVHIPPLRERPEDIAYLGRYFIQMYCSENRIPEKELSPGALNKLRAYTFPGNVRELKSLIELAVVMSNTESINEDDIYLDLLQQNKFVFTQEKTLKEYDTMIIKHFLKKYNNKVNLVAEKLDIGKSTLYRFISEEGIEI